MNETVIVTIYGRYGWGGRGRCRGGDGGIEGVWGLACGAYYAETGVRAKKVRWAMFVLDRMHACMQNIGCGGQGMITQNLSIGFSWQVLWVTGLAYFSLYSNPQEVSMSSFPNMVAQLH